MSNQWRGGNRNLRLFRNFFKSRINVKKLETDLNNIRCIETHTGINKMNKSSGFGISFLNGWPQL